MTEGLHTREDALYQLLSPQVRSLMEAVLEEDRDYKVLIPDEDTVDLPLEMLGSLVARSSNVYGRATRFAGMARANQKLAKGRYERKFKRNRVGSNKEDRERAAMEACDDEHIAMTMAESIVELAESLEQASRVASESARKIYDKVASMNTAGRREERGTYQDSDFSPY